MPKQKLNWENDNVQFARLLAEIRAIGLTPRQIEFLSESMGLEIRRIEEILERADRAFEKTKGRLP